MTNHVTQEQIQRMVDARDMLDVGFDVLAEMDEDNDTYANNDQGVDISDVHYLTEVDVIDLFCYEHEGGE